MTTSILDPLRDFPWDAVTEKAALLVAEGQRTRKSIAAEIDVHPDTIRNWSLHPDFRDKVRSIVESTRAALLETGILNKQERIGSMQDTWQRLRQIIEDRSEALEYQHIPGGSTGLLVHRTKIIGSGRAATQVEEYELDTGLLAEMRNLLKHIAQEQGQWVEKNETEHSITRIDVVYQDMLPENL